MFVHPGKKLMFMGSEFGQVREWEPRSQPRLAPARERHRLPRPDQAVRQRSQFQYQRERSLHEVDFEPSGFQWIDCNDSGNSVVSLIRRAKDPQDFTVALVNFTPIARYGYSDRRPGAEAVPRDSEQRLGVVRRRRCR